MHSCPTRALKPRQKVERQMSPPHGLWLCHQASGELHHHRPRTGHVITRCRRATHREPTQRPQRQGRRNAPFWPRIFRGEPMPLCPNLAACPQCGHDGAGRRGARHRLRRHAAAPTQRRARVWRLSMTVWRGEGVRSRCFRPPHAPSRACDDGGMCALHSGVTTHHVMTGAHRARSNALPAVLGTSSAQPFSA